MTAATRARTRAAARQDRRTARLAELDAIGGVLVQAGEEVDRGWVQGEWAASGGLCLVSSIRAHSTHQLRARCLDLVWCALHEAPGGGVSLLARVPPPAVRLARVRDLTRWNDRPGRARDDVLALLADARVLAALEMERLRSELGRVGRTPATRG